MDNSRLSVETGNDVLKEFYNKMEALDIQINGIFIFVYNGMDSYCDDPHLEECFDDSEVHEILDSVNDLFKETKAFSSEEKFIKWCTREKNENYPVFVYSMAQYVPGFGRRTLIPAICEYYGFININADAYMSAIGCNKSTMYTLLTNTNFSHILPKTHFINSINELEADTFLRDVEKTYVVKPINESCCIDVTILSEQPYISRKEIAKKLLTKYGHFMIQEYIDGDEVGITVIFHNGLFYTLTPMQIIFFSQKKYLTHEDSYYNNYKLKERIVDNQILNKCREISQELGFKCTTRLDFRITDDDFFLFDISPNPTINGYVSSNLAAQATLGCDRRGIFRFMIYEKLPLLEPSLYRTKQI